MQSRPARRGAAALIGSVGWVKRSLPTIQKTMARRKRALAHPTKLLMPHFRLYDGSANFSAAVRAFIGEVDFRHAPMRLDVAQIHGQSDAARTNDEVRFDIVVMMD